MSIAYNPRFAASFSAEEQLKISEEKYRIMAMYTYDWEYWVDPDGYIVYCSPSCERITGYTQKEFMDEPDLLRKIIYPEDWELMSGHFEERNPDDGQECMCDFRIVTKAGIVLWVGHRCIPVYNENGQYLGRRGSNREITDLKNSQHELELTLDATADGIWKYTIPTDVLYFSPRYYSMLGYSFGEFPATYEAWKTLLHPDDYFNAESAFESFINNSVPVYSSEFRMRTKSGKYIWIHGSGRVVEWTVNGTPLRIIGTQRDITHFKDAEQEQLKVERQLYHVQKLESLGLLAGGIAHDFNNFLGGLLGYIDLAKACSTEEKITDILDRAVLSFDKAKGLTRQLLTFAKGGEPICTMGRIQDVVVETARFSTSGSRIKLVFTIDENLWLCNFDPTQVSQVISNLIINAQHAMPAGGVINVTISNYNNSGLPLYKEKYVKISVIDSGIGISEEHLPHIFEPFFTTKQQGCGLGLATSYSIVKKHEGIMTVDSEPGKGAVFNVFLPANGKETGVTVPVRTNEEHKGKGKVLIYDDEVSIAFITADMVKSMGYVPVIASTSQEALDAVSAINTGINSMVLAILDLTVPGDLGGKDLVVRIGEINARLPVIAMSGYSEDPVMTKPNDFGFLAAVPKPFTIAELGNALNLVMGEQQTKAG